MYKPRKRVWNPVNTAGNYLLILWTFATIYAVLLQLQYGAV